MRYTHNFKLIRHRKHQIKISLVITGVLIVLVIVLGFSKLDANQFFFGFFESLIRVVVSYFISVILAVGLSLCVMSSKKVEEVMLPILDVMQSFPSFALFPLLVIWFGRTSIVTIFILIISMIWPILFTLLSAQKQMREDLIEAAKFFGASGWRYFSYVLFPLYLPALVTGSIVAWGEAWEAIIAAEIIVQVPGVGTYLAQSGDNLNSQVLLIGIFLLLIMLFILNKYIWLPLLNFTTEYQTD